MSFAIEHHEEAQHADAGDLDNSAPGHPIEYIIEKIGSVAAYRQHNKGVQQPEFVAGGRQGVGDGMVFHWT